MFVIIDDLLEEQDRQSIVEHSFDLDSWYIKGQHPLQEKIIDKVGEFFDLSSMVGYEIWCNSGYPKLHKDIDDELFRNTGKLSFPLCSIVYYASVGDNMIGGQFATKEMILVPKTNRLLAFSKGIEHEVYPFSGDRIAISINPWDKVPMGMG
jgi:hypothetical protein